MYEDDNLNSLEQDVEETEATEEIPEEIGETDDEEEEETL
jgi:hypothetical protein